MKRSRGRIPKYKPAPKKKKLAAAAAAKFEVSSAYCLETLDSEDNIPFC